MNNDLVKIETDNGEVELSAEIIRKYLVPTGRDGKAAAVTDQEVTMFLNLCKYQRLNPFLREVYLIKYGSSPATMVTGKETFLKRAMKNPKYKGHETLITDDGQVATAKVYVDGYVVPITVSVDFVEYVGMKDEYQYDPKQGKSVATGKKVPNGMWATKPKTMLKKVALVQALREAFPDDFGGLYSQEEISHVDVEKLPIAPVETPSEIQKEDLPKEEKSVETVTPETVNRDENPFKPYAKGGENVKPVDKAPKTVMLGTSKEEKPASPATMIDDIKAKSAKLRDEYSTKISELKTRAQCEALMKDLATKAGWFTELDRDILRAAFASKRDEITAALPKAETAPRPEFKIGDKVKVRAKPGGSVALEGEITSFKTVDNKEAVTLKGAPMPVFLANCYLE